MKFEDKVEQVREILENRVEWATQYVEEHEDYASGYSHIVCGQSHKWPKRIEEWLEDNYEGSADKSELASSISEYADKWEFEAERNPSDYGGYYGSGCCLWSFKIEEIEEQIDVNSEPILRDLQASGELDDILDELDCEFCISRSQKRENQGTEEKPCYREVGRKLVNPYDKDHPTFAVYAICSGGWDFAIPAERMNELVCEALERLTESEKQFE